MKRHATRSRILFAALLILLQGCDTIIVPPKVASGGVPVFLLDHGRHSSLVLPTPSGHIVRYAYGDWHYYALAETTPYRALGALFWPTQGALGRRELPGPPTLAAVEQQVKVPIVHVYPLIVESSKAEALRDHLQAIFTGNAANLVYNPLYDLYFVPDPQPYDLAHTSNQEVADWLMRLGCQIRGGPTFLSNWKIQH